MKLQSFSIPNLVCIVAIEILFHFMERSAHHKNVLKRTKCQYFNHPPRARRVSVDRRVPETVPRRSAKRVCWKKIFSALVWYEWNVPPMELVFVSVSPISGGLQPTLFDGNDWLFGKQTSKWRATWLMFDTSFCHAKYSAAFVSGIGFRDSRYPDFIKFLLLAHGSHSHDIPFSRSFEVHFKEFSRTVLFF